MKGRKIPYSQEELDWIEARREMPRRDLHAQFCDAFDRGDVTPDSLKQLCLRKGWKTGRDGRLQPGNVPANKGKKMPYNANSARTQFKKGQLSGNAARLAKPIGAERLSKEGYLERKIHNGLPMQSRWRAVHLLRWEEMHGPIPKGMALKNLSGDRTNTDPDNWALIPRAMLPRLNGRFGRDFDAAPVEAKPTIMAIVQLEHKARTMRKGKKRKAA